MYAIYGDIYHQYTPNVSIYAIHGSYGIYDQKNSWFGIVKFSGHQLIGFRGGGSGTHRFLLDGIRNVDPVRHHWCEHKATGSLGSAPQLLCVNIGVDYLAKASVIGTTDIKTILLGSPCSVQTNLLKGDERGTYS